MSMLDHSHDPVPNVFGPGIYILFGILLAGVFLVLFLMQ